MGLTCEGPRTYHDRVFGEEINDLINITKGHYEKVGVRSRRPSD